ncbi:MAG TPA: BON domain-containing protein, partial [Burkholderiaceae bacterium]|nr:BON domain-containing protein [Burkholderiaceae bacterium]
MNDLKTLAGLAIASALFAGCATQKAPTTAAAAPATNTAKPAAADAAGTRIVKSRDGRFDGE